MKMKRRIPILLLTFLLTFLFGSLTVSAADESSPLILDATSVKLNIGESIEINALGGGIAPDGKTPVWTSYNVNIATVDNVNGKPTTKDGVNANTVTVMALRKGKTTVSARVGTTRKTCTITVVDPSIKMNKKTATLYVKGAEADAAETNTNTVKLTATVKGTTNKQVSWKSSNTKVATVDGEGNVTAHAAGTVVISATTTQGAPKTASCTVTVKQNSLVLNEGVSAVQLSTQGSGKTVKLATTVVGSSKKVKWNSLDPKVVKVDQKGKLTATGTGETTITANANGIEKSCTVNVTSGIAITTKRATLYTGALNKNKPVGNTITLKTNVAKAQRSNLSWSIIQNSEVVGKTDKNDGTTLITAVRPGTATITATLTVTDADGKENTTTDTCVITVKETSTTIQDTDIQLKTKGISKTYTLNYQVVGPKASVTWKTSNKNIATVSKGKITAKKEGAVEIWAIANGKESDHVSVTVGPYDPSIKVNQEKYTLYTNKGNTVTLKATVDAPAADKKVEWITSDENVATVSTKGKVTAKGEGQTYITVKSKTNPSLHAECLITVINSEARMEAEGFQEKDAVHENSLYIKKGEKADLMVDVVGSSQSVTYKVMNCFDTVANKSVKSGIITVSKKGLITAKKVGTADVKVTANGVSSICHVTVHDQEEVCKHDKEEDKFETIVPASCKESGRKEKRCSLCGYVATVEIPKEPHNYETEGTVVAEPTCIKKGLIEFKCMHYNDCGSKKIEQIEETDHVWTAKNGDAANIAPTCTERGFRTEYCTTCNATRQVTLPALGHSFGKWMVTKPATKEEAGSKERVCVRCGEKEEEIIPMKPSYDVVTDEGELENSKDLVWHDEFNGTTLNTADWNYELHEPGWVNSELQEYVDNSANFEVKDGKLHIKAIKSEQDGKTTYTSGRINTQGNQDFTYGRFEARIQVPSGKGFLPAFWMMPTDESYYGQWPKCGEIDIMEVLGSKTDTTYGTLHFGEPHTESQGSYTLKTDEETVKDFAEDFHVYACEWEPGEIRFYVDGILFHTANNWFTKREGFGEVAYPAPYDQPFYMILNLAVGGTWPGAPDEDTFGAGNTKELIIDYVRVYQKDADYYAAMEVEKPDVEVVLRDPDETGNYIYNGDFSISIEEPATTPDCENWELHLESDGKAVADTTDEVLKIETTEAGALDYSVQIIQGSIPMEQGCQYKLTFKAKADEARSITTAIKAPDAGWAEYLKANTLDLTTEWKPFTYTFDMTANSDANGRLEFNFGNQNSTATVYIDDVRLEKTGVTVEIPEVTKSVLPDGNYVYNGQFDEGNEPGKERLDYWDLDVKVEGADVSVTKDAARKLRVSVPEDEDVTLDQIVVKQSPVAITGGKTYTLTFDAHVDETTYNGEAKTIKAQIAGRTFTAALTDEVQTCKYKFDTAESLKGSELRFLLGTTGITYIDNVRVQEDGLIINGDFSAGLVGYEPFIDSSASASYIVDSLNEDNAFCMDITDTGDADWKIQLKQNDIELENGKWYRLSLDAKSTLDRKIMYALQRDGLSHKTPDGAEDWTPYAQEIVSLTSEYQTLSAEFKMDYDDDPNTILSISMGAVGGTRITDKHTVTIDNIKLEIIDEPEQKPDEPGDLGVNLIKDPEFAEGETYWTPYVSAETTAEADVSFAEGKATFDIKDSGENNWDIQLKQAGLRLEKGAEYNVSFKIKSTKARSVVYGFQDSSYNSYENIPVDLPENDTKTVDYDFTFNHATSEMAFFLSMGKTENVDTPASTIEISEVSLIKTKDGDGGDEPEIEPVAPGTDLIRNGDFANGTDEWTNGTYGDGKAEFTVEDGKAVYKITSVGSADSNVQLKQEGLQLESGQSYRVKFMIESNVTRKARFAFLTPTYDWYGGGDIDLTANTPVEVDEKIAIGSDKETSNKMVFQISMGYFEGDNITYPNTIKIDDVSIVKLGDDSGDEPGTDTDGNLIKNGDFSKENGESWENGTCVDGKAVVSFDGAAVFVISNVGTDDFHVQLKQTGLTLEKDKWYEIGFEAQSTKERKIIYALQEDNVWTTYSKIEKVDLTSESKPYSHQFQMKSDDSSNVVFCIKMGKIEGSETIGSHTITIDNVFLKEIEEPEQDPIESIEPGTEMIKNGNFDDSEDNGKYWAGGKQDDGQATVTYGNNKATFNITSVGTNEYASGVVLGQEGLTLEPGCTYRVKFKIKSSATRTVKFDFLDSAAGYIWYGGKDKISLTQDQEEEVEEDITIENDKTISNTILFQIAMGWFANEAPGKHDIEISEVSIMKLRADTTSSLTVAGPVTITDKDAADEPEEAIGEGADSDEEEIIEDEKDSKDEEVSKDEEDLEDDTDSEEEADSDSETDVAEETGVIPESTTEIKEE